MPNFHFYDKMVSARPSLPAHNQPHHGLPMYLFRPFRAMNCNNFGQHRNPSLVNGKHEAQDSYKGPQRTCLPKLNIQLDIQQPCREVRHSPGHQGPQIANASHNLAPSIANKQRKSRYSLLIQHCFVHVNLHYLEDNLTKWHSP